MNLTTIVLSIVLGIATGVAASLAAWWILFRYLAPSLKLDDRLNYYRIDGDKTARSQVRLDVGRRAIVELRLTVSLTIPNLVREGSVETLALYRRESDFVQAGKAPRYRIRVDMMIDDTFRRFRRHLGDVVADHVANQRPLDLKVLFREHPGSEIVVTAIARDAFTGAAGVTQGHYGEDSLVEGRVWDA